MFLPLLIYFCIAVFSSGAYDLPSYIPKCSASDPNLGQCVIDKANAVIPRFAKGDAKLAIPSLSPLSMAELTMKGDNLEMQWFDVYTDDLKDFRYTVAEPNFTPNETSYYEGYINRFTMRGTNYNILSGNILGIPAYGSGNFVMTLVGVTIKLTEYFKVYQRDGETYFIAEVARTSTEVERAYYYFENIQSPCVDNVNAYIEENWEEFTRQIEPALSLHFSAFTTSGLLILSSKIPVNKILLP